MSSDKSEASRPQYRSTAMDRVFGDARIVAITGPIAGLDAQSVRASLTVAEKSAADARLALGPTTDRKWSYRTDIAANTVETRADLDTDDLGRTLTDVRNRPGTRGPLEAVVCGDYLAIDYSHCIGDGQIGMMLLATLPSDPDGSRTPGLATGLPSTATWNALWRHYSANPSTLRDFWQLRKKHKRRPDSSARPTRKIENWESAKVSRSGYMDSRRLTELRTWSAEHAPGATAASVSVALWSAAVRAQGVRVDDHIMILFNSRRYLPREYLAAHGNFAVGIPLHLPAGSSPADVTSTMKEVIDSGWPIAVLGMSEVKDLAAAVRPGSTVRAAVPSVVEVPDLLRLAVSDLGKLRMFDHVEWVQDGRPPQLAASLEPDGPDGATMLISELAGGRTYTASFCSKMIEPSIIEAALEALCTDPVALVQDVRF